MKGVDTNILIYAHRAETKQHRDSHFILKELSEGGDIWGIAWPSFYEFVRVVTHRKIFHPPSTSKEAYNFLNDLVVCPTLRILSHGSEHWKSMNQNLFQIGVKGNLVFDSQIVSIFLENGISEVITYDSDFYRFRDIKVSIPDADCR